MQLDEFVEWVKENLYTKVDITRMREHESSPSEICFVGICDEETEDDLELSVDKNNKTYFIPTIANEDECLYDDSYIEIITDNDSYIREIHFININIEDLSGCYYVYTDVVSRWVKCNLDELKDYYKNAFIFLEDSINLYRLEILKNIFLDPIKFKIFTLNNLSFLLSIVDKYIKDTTCDNCINFNYTINDLYVYLIVQEDLDTDCVELELDLVRRLITPISYAEESSKYAELLIKLLNTIDLTKEIIPTDDIILFP